MKISLSALLVVANCLMLTAQGNPNFDQILNADTLGFDLLQTRHTPKSSCKTIVEGELRFDFQNQYPYYQSPFPQVIGDSVELILKQLPKTGYIYVYSVDPQNNPVLHKNVPHKIKEIKPGDRFFISGINYEGSYRFCMLYTHAPMNDPQRFVEAMELTQGAFLFRQQAMYGNKLLLPQRTWKLKEDGFGIYFDPKVFQGMDDGKILVYLEMPAQTKSPKD
jgi:hypothetical protein